MWFPSSELRSQHVRSAASGRRALREGRDPAETLEASLSLVEKELNIFIYKNTRALEYRFKHALSSCLLRTSVHWRVRNREHSQEEL